MDGLSNALTAFGAVLIVGGVTVLIVAVVWLRRESAAGRARSGAADDAQRLEIRRSALLAETVPLPPVPAAAPTAAPRPPVVTAAPRPPVVTAAPRPSVATAAPRPSVATAAPRPSVATATAQQPPVRPGARTAPNAGPGGGAPAAVARLMPGADPAGVVRVPRPPAAATWIRRPDPRGQSPTGRRPDRTIDPSRSPH